MSVQTQTKTSILQANLGDLPIFKNNSFSQEAITTKIDTFRKGEKSVFWFLKLAVFGVIGWGVFTYVLPPVFQAIGQMAAAVATGLMILTLILAAPAIVKWLRIFARFLHKTAIKHDPFAQLEIERGKLLQNQNKFRIAKSNINQLTNDMQLDASNSEKEANSGQARILALDGKAQKLKATRDNLIKENGLEIKGDDKYVEVETDLQKTLAELQRVVNKTNQAKEFIQKYGTRASIMKKMGQKLTYVETAMEIKISDFDTTVEMLKKDYAFGQKANAATSAAKSALGFSKSWELDYALEVVTSTISADIAMTSGNLRDIETLTSNFNLDSDEMFANLNLVADKIRIGEDVIPQAKSYSNPEYKLTQSDKIKSGGFGTMFD